MAPYLLTDHRGARAALGNQRVYAPHHDQPAPGHENAKHPG
ncbi:MAG: hypothetical protein JWQ79_2246, partial [Mucilaginibacter sp.]|nr:hypothetical protein [Mucilaginibacter sp.]